MCKDVLYLDLSRDQDLSLILLDIRVWNCLVLDFYTIFGTSTRIDQTWVDVNARPALAHGHFWHSCSLGVSSSRHRTACYLVKVEQYAIIQVNVGLCNRGRSRGRERWMRSFRTVWKIISLPSPLPSNENKPDTPLFLPLSLSSRARKRTIGLVNHCRSISSRSLGAGVKEKKMIIS